jgi:hypothetical protein
MGAISHRVFSQKEKKEAPLGILPTMLPHISGIFYLFSIEARRFH